MKRFTNILFVADNELGSQSAFTRALSLARNNQASLTIAAVVQVSSREKTAADDETRRLVDALSEDRADALNRWLQSFDLGGIEVETKVLVGSRFLEVVREVMQHERDLVIKSVEDVGSPRLFGSTDMKLMRKCPCPVWIIKPEAEPRYRRIVAALDYDPDNDTVDALNRQIVEMASSLALSEFAELHVVHAWRIEHEDFLRSPRGGLTAAEIERMSAAEMSKRTRWLEALVEEHGAEQDRTTLDYLNPTVHLPKGAASRLVPALADELGAELIVMGTVGRTGVQGILVGNTAEDILHQIHCSVLTVKPPGFVTPVTLS